MSVFILILRLHVFCFLFVFVLFVCLFVVGLWVKTHFIIPPNWFFNIQWLSIELCNYPIYWFDSDVMYWCRMQASLEAAIEGKRLMTHHKEPYIRRVMLCMWHPSCWLSCRIVHMQLIVLISFNIRLDGSFIDHNCDTSFWGLVSLFFMWTYVLHFSPCLSFYWLDPWTIMRRCSRLMVRLWHCFDFTFFVCLCDVIVLFSFWLAIVCMTVCRYQLFTFSLSSFLSSFSFLALKRHVISTLGKGMLHLISSLRYYPRSLYYVWMYSHLSWLGLIGWYISPDDLQSSLFSIHFHVLLAYVGERGIDWQVQSDWTCWACEEATRDQTLWKEGPTRGRDKTCTTSQGCKETTQKETFRWVELCCGVLCCGVLCCIHVCLSISLVVSKSKKWRLVVSE